MQQKVAEMKLIDINCRLSWMAPEVLRDREKMTCFSDVYAIGVFLWEVWTVGQLPYTEILSNPQINERTKVEMVRNQ